MKLEEIKQMALSHVLAPTGDQFCDYRTDLMLDDEKNYGNKVEPYYSFFYRLTEKLQPKVVVELGGWRGDSACHFARATTGKVITIDHHTDPGDHLHREAMLDTIENCPNVIYLQGWTTDEDALEQKGQHALGDADTAYHEVVHNLRGQSIDLLFIDSWHDYEHCKRDWDTYSPLLSDNALVILDDVVKGVPGGGLDNVKKFWDELEGDKFIAENIHLGNRVGFWRKK